MKVEIDGQHFEMTLPEVVALEKQRREARQAAEKGLSPAKEESKEEAELRHANEWSEGHGGYDDASDHFPTK